MIDLRAIDLDHLSSVSRKIDDHDYRLEITTNAAPTHAQPWSFSCVKPPPPPHQSSQRPPAHTPRTPHTPGQPSRRTPSTYCHGPDFSAIVMMNRCPPDVAARVPAAERQARRQVRLPLRDYGDVLVRRRHPRRGLRPQPAPARRAALSVLRGERERATHRLLSASIHAAPASFCRDRLAARPWPARRRAPGSRVTYL